MRQKPFAEMLVGARVACAVPGAAFVGEVVGETKHTLVVETARGMRMVLKQVAEVSVPGRARTLSLAGKNPEDRFKGA